MPKVVFLLNGRGLTLSLLTVVWKSMHLLSPAPGTIESSAGNKTGVINEANQSRTTTAHSPACFQMGTTTFANVSLGGQQTVPLCMPVWVPTHHCLLNEHIYNSWMHMSKVRHWACKLVILWLCPILWFRDIVRNLLLNILALLTFTKKPKG